LRISLSLTEEEERREREGRGRGRGRGRRERRKGGLLSSKTTRTEWGYLFIIQNNSQKPKLADKAHTQLFLEETESIHDNPSRVSVS
jgi:hypothetical protein